MEHLTSENSSEEFLEDKIADEGRGLGGIPTPPSRAQSAPLLWPRSVLGRTGRGQSTRTGRLDGNPNEGGFVSCHEAGVL